MHKFFFAIVFIIASVSPVLAQGEYFDSPRRYLSGKPSATEHYQNKILLAGTHFLESDTGRYGAVFSKSTGNIVNKISVPYGKIIRYTADDRGGWIILGNFRRVDDEEVEYIARLDSNGHVDTAFKPALGSILNRSSYQYTEYEPDLPEEILVVDSFLYMVGEFNRITVNTHPSMLRAVKRINLNTGLVDSWELPLLITRGLHISTYNNKLIVFGKDNSGPQAYAYFKIDPGAKTVTRLKSEQTEVLNFCISDTLILSVVDGTFKPIRAYSINSGIEKILSFSLTRNSQAGKVRDIISSNDTVYVAGMFDKVDGQNRAGVFVFNSQTLSMDNNLYPPSGLVYLDSYTIQIDGSKAFLTGNYTNLPNNKKAVVYDLASHTKLDWEFKIYGTYEAANRFSVNGNKFLLAGDMSHINPKAGAYSDILGINKKDFSITDYNIKVNTNTSRPNKTASINDLLLDGHLLYIAGNFDSINGIPRNGVGCYDLKGDSLTAWRPTSVVFNSSFVQIQRIEKQSAGMLVMQAPRKLIIAYKNRDDELFSSTDFKNGSFDDFSILGDLVYCVGGFIGSERTSYQTSNSKQDTARYGICYNIRFDANTTWNITGLIALSLTKPNFIYVNPDSIIAISGVSYYRYNGGHNIRKTAFIYLDQNNNVLYDGFPDQIKDITIKYRRGEKILMYAIDSSGDNYTCEYDKVKHGIKSRFAHKIHFHSASTADIIYMDDDWVYCHAAELDRVDTAIVTGTQNMYETHVFTPKMGVFRMKPNPVNSYSGNIYFDKNHNSTIDTGDVFIPHTSVFLEGINEISTDKDGKYIWYSNNDTVLIKPDSIIHMLSMFPDSITKYTTALGDSFTKLNFLVEMDTVFDLHNDFNILPVKPGKKGGILTDIKHIGGIKGDVKYTLVLDSNLEYKSSPIQPDSIRGDSLIFVFNDFNPFQRKRFLIKVLADTSLNTGDSIRCYITIEQTDKPAPSRYLYLDTLRIAAVASYDPNDKSAFPPGAGDYGVVPEDVDEFTYRIRFQNTGEDTAFKVVLIDTIDAEFDPATIEILSASHDYNYFLKDSVLKVVFDDILLPDSLTDPTGSNGYFKFKIKTNSSVTRGTELTNNVDIFFDYNSPVRTNTAINTLYDCDSILVLSYTGYKDYCEYEMINFINNGVDVENYSWYLDDTLKINDTSYNYELMYPGKHTITLTSSSTYCNSAKSIEISVKELIKPDLTLSADKICDTGTALIMSNKYEGFNWYKDDVFVGAAQDDSFYTNNKGTYYLKSDSVCTLISDTVLLDVVTTVKPKLSSLDSVACKGETITVNTDVYDKYTWYISSIPLVPAISNSKVFSSDGTIYLSSGEYCYLNSDTIALKFLDKVKPGITLLGDTPVCVGNLVSLETSQSANYSWYKDGVAVGGGNSFNPTQTGEYYLYSDSMCHFSSDSFYVKFNPLPAKPTIMQVGKVLTSSSASVNLWYKDGAGIAGANKDTFKVISDGYYQVEIIDPTTGCTNISDSLFVKVSSVVNISEGVEVLVYPNPFSSSATLVLSKLPYNNMHYTLTDLTGRVVKESTIESEKIDISRGNLAGGIYYLNVYTNSQKLISIKLNID